METIEMEPPVFKCKMVETTNPSFQHRIGRTRMGSFERGMFWMNNFHTSYVISAEQTDNMITIKTRNSVYKIEVLDGHIIDNINLTNEDIDKIEYMIRKYKDIE